MKAPAILAVMMSCAALAACNTADTPPADTGAFGTGAAGTGADGTGINDPGLNNPGVNDPSINDPGAGMDRTVDPYPELEPGAGTMSTDPALTPAPGAGADIDQDTSDTLDDGAMQDQPRN